MAIARFQPQYLQPSDYPLWNLPASGEQADIDNLVRLASIIIDQHCGRVDLDGGGSLCYSTYDETILLQNDNRNLVVLSHKPIVALSSAQIATLTGSATADANYTYTGVQPYLYNSPEGSPSGLIGASGRYGYTREDRAVGYPDLYAMINPLNLVTMFGGPAPWTPIDIKNTSYNWKSGEVWVPAGIMLQRYSEIRLQYVAGYDPLNMPWAIKQACSMMVKAAMVQGDGTAALTSMTLGRSGATAMFSPGYVDATVDTLLTPFKSVVGR